VTGLINVEFKKPENSERLHFNMYTSNAGQLEVNANSAHRFNDRLSTGILAHYSFSDFRLDHNHDGFIDHPLIRQLNVMNRWKYFTDNIETRFGVRLLTENRMGGQRMPASSNHLQPSNPWLMDANNTTGEAFAKIGFISQSRAATSVGWINNAHWHRKDALFGSNNYFGEQQSLYSNLIFQSYIGNTAHTYNTGLSIVHDRFNERLNDSIFDVTETVPGAFFEYTYNNFKGLTLIAGIRGDYHSRFGFFATPRFHIRFEADTNTIIRASAGTGARSPRILSENIHLLASSRRIIVQEEPRMERAVNFGMNITRHFNLAGRRMTVNAEAYRTYFNDQVVVDLDKSPNQVVIYNLDGESWSNSYQVEMLWEPIDRLEMVLAYRWMDVRVTQEGELVRKPLVNRYKGIVNLSYATNLRRWQFDFTAQFNGNTRLPTRNHPEEFELPEYSPAYTVILAQVSRFFRDWNVYVGVENLTNFVQKNPIIYYHDPTSPWFDSSMIYGPILGRKIYAGIRYNIP
ncbi:MAG TPA: TonB-dependent receptor, partial [Bacteroidales bacterium]|nr:TonB-dependent receptor [Bacteroidales bacterium]